MFSALCDFLLAWFIVLGLPWLVLNIGGRD